MRKWIKPTRKKIGRYGVGQAFQVSRRDARVYVALGLAEEVDGPEPKTVRKKKYKRRDVKKAPAKVVMTPEESSE